MTATELVEHFERAFRHRVCGYAWKAYRDVLVGADVDECWNDVLLGVWRDTENGSAEWLRMHEEGKVAGALCVACRRRCSDLLQRQRAVRRGRGVRVTAAFDWLPVKSKGVRRNALTAVLDEDEVRWTATDRETVRLLESAIAELGMHKGALLLAAERGGLSRGAFNMRLVTMRRRLFNAAREGRVKIGTDVRFPGVARAALNDRYGREFFHERNPAAVAA